MTYPVFASGDVLNASDMNAVGLWLVKTQTVGTAQTSTTVSSVFSSSYDNYKVILSGIDWSVADTTVQFQPGGVSSLNYYGGGYYQIFGGGLNAFSLNAGAAGGVGITSTEPNGLVVDVLNPFVAQRTYMIGSLMIGQNYVANYSSMLATNTSYTSLVVSPASGTMTGGTISVYGYKK